MWSLWLMAAGLGALAAAGTLIYQFRQVRAQRSIQESLTERTGTVNRLLEFSQTIQGAGKPDQIFASLSHYLKSELGLWGLVILTNDAEAVPGIELRTAWPENLITTGALAEMEPALCPCLRQNLPRLFKPDNSPVRCGIDSSLNLPATHPAYCIPFTIGTKVQAVVHMVLPPRSEWSEQRRQLAQLAQTYINSAQSVLTSLNLLAEAEKQSMTDALTGLYNRRSMDQLLQREVAMAERYGHPMSVVMIDLDFFKEINDAHGHAAGDHMLRAFADCVRITLRKTDLAFRYGGDEFVIALPQTPLFQAQQVVQKLRQAFLSVDFSHAIAHLDKNPTLSIGVAERSKTGNILALASLLSAADQALYNAKNSNRNCVRVFEPPQAA
jgi:diguanylate cyclase (GGDEF)-like protein